MNKQERQCTYNVTSKRFHETIVAAKKSKKSDISVCACACVRARAFVRVWVRVHELWRVLALV